VTAHPLRRLFAPRGIAMVGASDGSDWSRRTFANLRTGGYAGAVHCVNPRRDTVHGAPAYPSLSAVPGPVDLAYVLVGTDAVPAVLDEAAACGIGHLVVIAAGFGEAGPEGRARERRLRRKAADNGQVLLGPNNLGFVNAVDDVMAFSQAMPAEIVRGGVGLLLQSGALGIFVLEYLRARDVGISHLVTMGNEATITVTEVMEYLLADERTRVIALFVESVRRPERFAALAREALRRGKPVVLCKVGRSRLGARAAAAHTGALTGNDRVLSAVLEQLGVIQVDSIEDLVVTAGLLDAYGALPGDRVAVVTGSGAACGVVGDLADREGLRLPDLAPSTVDALRAVLPPFATPQNPLDVTGYNVTTPDLAARAREILVTDPGVDLVVVNTGLPLAPVAEASAAKQRDHRRLADLLPRSPAALVLMDFLAKDVNAAGRAYRAELGLPHVVCGLERGIPALARALRWAGRHRAASAVDPPPAPLIADAPLTAGAWTEVGARELLAGAGVPVVPGEVATDAARAVAAADRLGYPVAVKVVSPDIAHKSDVGGVALDLADAAAVRRAYAAVTAAGAGARVDGVLVTAMRPPSGVDLLLGLTDDRDWGPLLTIALGGIWVEVLADAAIRRLPVDAGEVGTMLAGLRGAPLLAGSRGGTPADLGALCAVVLRFAALGPRLAGTGATLEVNPLRVDGADIVALDALVSGGADGSA
jgi:acetate---CoA ligase (ADP-forming)